MIGLLFSPVSVMGGGGGGGGEKVASEYLTFFHNKFGIFSLVLDRVVDYILPLSGY